MIIKKFESLDDFFNTTNVLRYNRTLDGFLYLMDNVLQYPALASMIELFDKEKFIYKESEITGTYYKKSFSKPMWLSDYREFDVYSRMFTCLKFIIEFDTIVKIKETKEELLTINVQNIDDGDNKYCKYVPAGTSLTEYEKFKEMFFDNTTILDCKLLKEFFELHGYKHNVILEQERDKIANSKINYRNKGAYK